MSYLRPTPPEKLVDRRGRPYFLWSGDLTLDQFRERLETGSEAERARLLGALLREARPDDAFLFVTPDQIRAAWSSVEKHLGQRRDFWRWLLDKWDEQGVA